jgi:WD40 repeat protein
MRTRPPRTVAGLALGHLTVAGLVVVSAFLQADPGDKPDPHVPPDKAVVQLLDVPEGAKVLLDGQNQGAERPLKVPVPAGQWQRHHLQVEVSGATLVDRMLVLTGGWQVKVRAQTASPRPELVVQTGHNKTVNAVAFSPDGSQVLTGSSDGTAILWDTVSGRQVETFQGSNKAVYAAAFSPDGKLVLTGSADMTATLWNTSDGKPLRAFKGHTGVVSAVASSADGSKVLTGSDDKTAILWDAANGQILRTFKGHSRPVNSVALSRDGRQVLTGSDDTTAKLWNADDERQNPRTIKGHRGPVTSVAFNSDGNKILTGSRDRTAILWDTAGYRLMNFDGSADSPPKSHTEVVASVAFCPTDDNKILTGSWDRTATLWDAKTGRRLQTFKDGHTEGIYAVAFSRDGRQLLTGSKDNTAALWNTAGGAKVRTFQGYNWLVDSVAFSPDGSKLLAGSRGRMATLWDTAADQRPRVLQKQAFSGSAVCFSPDGRQVLTGSDDNAAILLNLDDGQKCRFDGHESWVTAVAFSPDGSKVLTGSQDRTARLWEVKTGREIRKFAGHTSPVNAVAFSPDGRQVLTGSDDGTVILWEADGNGTPARSFKAHTEPVTSVAFNRDGTKLLTASLDNTAILWDATGGQTLRTFRHERPVHDACFSPDGGLVLTGCEDHTAILWDATNGQGLRSIEGHTAAVHAVAFGQKGGSLLTGSYDGTVRLWDLATGEERARLVSLDGGSDWLVVSPDGFFDGTAGGRQKVAYRQGADPKVVPVDAYFDKFYQSGLLTKIWHDERPMPTVPFGQKPPDVRIVSPAQDVRVTDPQVTVEVEATDRGAGLHGPWLVQGPTELTQPEWESRDGATVKRRFKVPLVEGPNLLKAVAAPEAGVPEVEVPLRVFYDTPYVKPDLYLLTVGVSKYPNRKGADLQYAASDADEINSVFNRRYRKLYDHIYPHPLTDSTATLDGIRGALADMRKNAKERDVLVLFLSGHGIMKDEKYYFIPSDFRDDVATQGLSADDLAKQLEGMHALQRVLVLDTCYSGGALSSAFAGAVTKLGRANGFCIAAASAKEEAQEDPNLRHGVLTYALLAGLGAVDRGPLKGGHADADTEGMVKVNQWISYAVEQVPHLMKASYQRDHKVNYEMAGQEFFRLLPWNDPEVAAK